MSPAVSGERSQDEINRDKAEEVARLRRIADEMDRLFHPAASPTLFNLDPKDPMRGGSSQQAEATSRLRTTLEELAADPQDDEAVLAAAALPQHGANNGLPSLIGRAAVHRAHGWFVCDRQERLESGMTGIPEWGGRQPEVCVREERARGMVCACGQGFLLRLIFLPVIS